MRSDVDASLCTEVALLVAQSRLGDTNRRQSKTTNLSDVRPSCAVANESSMMKQRAEQLFAAGLPLAVHTLLIDADCRLSDDACQSRGILLELWTIKVGCNRNIQTSNLHPHFLLQAIRSHLHFSQLNAWLINNQGTLPGAQIAYRVALLGEFDMQRDDFELHTFPACQIDRYQTMIVEVKSMQRSTKQPQPTRCDTCASRRNHSTKPDVTTSSFWVMPPLSSSTIDDCLQSSNDMYKSAFERLCLNDHDQSNKIDDTSSVRFYVSTDDDSFAKHSLPSSSTTIDNPCKLSPPESSSHATTTSLRTQPQKTTNTTNSSISDRRTRCTSRLSSFHHRTGLPLNSSPAPLKRNEHSFDYDASLRSISAIRSAIYGDNDSGSSDSEGSTCHCKSAPTSTHLLGNFEESALNGRIQPFGSVDGFYLDLAASGSFCPPHVKLPVTTFFFNPSDDDAPSPYLGHCNLEPLSRKGYRVPKKGTIQATLFNPQGTVVKMFVVRYDLVEMPAMCQTFVRQRTFFMPSSASLMDASQNRSWLRYLIHLRLATSQSGKLYVHTDIRMLFSRKSELDAYNCEKSTDSTTPIDSFELRSFTEMPTNPKYSPKK